MARINKYNLDKKFKEKRQKQWHYLVEIPSDNLPDRKEQDTRWKHAWDKRRIFACSCKTCRWEKSLGKYKREKFKDIE